MIEQFYELVKYSLKVFISNQIKFVEHIYFFFKKVFFWLPNLHLKLCLHWYYAREEFLGPTLHLRAECDIFNLWVVHHMWEYHFRRPIVIVFSCLFFSIFSVIPYIYLSIIWTRNTNHRISWVPLNASDLAFVERHVIQGILWHSWVPDCHIVVLKSHRKHLSHNIVECATIDLFLTGLALYYAFRIRNSDVPSLKSYGLTEIHTYILNMPSAPEERIKFS